MANPMATARVDVTQKTKIEDFLLGVGSATMVLMIEQEKEDLQASHVKGGNQNELDVSCHRWSV